jgi:hypothetical protein
MDFLQHYALSTGVASERKEDQHPHRWSSGVRWVNNALLLPRVLGKGWWCDAMQKDGKAGCFCKDLQVGRGRTCRASTGWSSLVGLKSQPSFFSQSKQARDHQSAKLEPAACSSSPRSNHPAKTMAYRRKQQGPVGADDRRTSQPQASTTPFSPPSSVPPDLSGHSRQLAALAPVAIEYYIGITSHPTRCYGCALRSVDTITVETMCDSHGLMMLVSPSCLPIWGQLQQQFSSWRSRSI